MRFRVLSTFISAVLGAAVAFAAPGKPLWSIGEADSRPDGFALAPDGFRDFVKNDFGYEDKYFLVGHSAAETDFPYVLPGPVDTWGGTWPTSGWRTHYVNILFDLEKVSEKEDYRIVVDLADYSKTFLPLVKISVNGHDTKVQLEADRYDLASQRKPGLMEPVTDTLSLSGDYSAATPHRIEVDIDGKYMKKGGNEITVTVLEGSWILFDRVALYGKGKIGKPSEIFIRNIEMTVLLDGEETYNAVIEKGRYQLEVPMPAVSKEVKSRYEIRCGDRSLAKGTVVRTPGRLQTLADYVDTRIGTAHSRWMIAPGPWMPFSMVKMSPDNQNPGWQAGYQPSFETVGCFSHIHEWTLGGLGIMATNGRLQTKVGDEQKPDEGYRSRIDKRSEQAGIGLYSVQLTDYDIKAEITATTRCGMERFSFPSDRGDGRILIDFHPWIENDFKIQEVSARLVNDKRIEGFVHQYAPGIWSNDADQDYTVHFVIEFDSAVKSMGNWCDDKITENVRNISNGPCTDAGLFLTFDTEQSPVVTVRSGISPVSIANAALNLESEMTGPFGWDFDAVVQNQKNVWNDLFERVTIRTDNRLEKVRFYNNMYRALCSRNTWSDVNGEWISTDGKVRRVADPDKDVMLGCDAFWNSFWNLNQFWNLVTPEWSSRWVGSQLAMYDANGWLAKGPAGLNYIPVMVAEHEIPLIVSAWQMGIRDFDGEKALEACVKMQTTPAQKVFKGFAGNRDIVPYMKYGYVPYDLGRFSNTMEYSFDDWTVGQLAKSLGKTDIYEEFNRRGYWWKNVISDDGWCRMKDSKGEWFPDFDPFRSGANYHYVEGNAWQLTFFVPQDVPALVEKIGKEKFTDRLLWGFNQDEAWRYNAPNDQYWDHPVVQGNQQSMHFAFLFNYAGMPWQTQRWSRSILDRYYGYGPSNAYLGDEDQGQMSAWAIMASLGLFQMDGGTNAEPSYEIASPLFEEVTIDLGKRYGRGEKFVIKANNASRKNIYVQSAVLNGKKLDSFRFPASELLKGGELVLEMGPEPNCEWGRE